MTISVKPLLNLHTRNQDKENAIKQKTKLFRVKSDNGRAFVAVSELLNIDEHQLLDELMGEYVKSVCYGILDVASHYPMFADRYPFIKITKQSG